MSATKSWIERIPLILEHLEKRPGAIFTPSEVAALFHCGRSAAYKLMQVAGAGRDENGDATVSRDNLRWYVLQCPESRRCMAEWERKKRLEQQLVQTAEEMRLRRVKIPMQPADEWPRWEDLPNVAVTGGRMEISFAGYQDLLHTLKLLCGAMADEKEFRRLTGEPEPDPDAMPMRQQPSTVTKADFDALIRLATPEEKARILAADPPAAETAGAAE